MAGERFEGVCVRACATYVMMQSYITQEVNSRKDRPWIITGAHRPMYCSTVDGDDCNRREGIVSVERASGNIYISIYVAKISPLSFLALLSLIS